jgi:putative endonuclease
VSTTSIGIRAEDAAIKYLQQNDVRILYKNFRCKLGEIDLIAQDQQYLVFAEVRFRATNEFGGAIESITLAKQRKIIRVAEFFLATRTWAQNVKCRFDVITMSQTVASPHIQWIKDAFDGEIY